MDQNDLEAVTSILAAAFQDSSFYRYIAPEPGERKNFLEAMFRYRLGRGLAAQETYLAVEGPRIVGMAAWDPPVLPGTAAPPRDDGFRKALGEFSPDIQERWFGFLTLLIDCRARVLRQPFWGLSPIAVLPEEQGKGYASQLIRKKLAEIDAQGLPCFLATQNKGNAKLYRRYKFKIYREDSIDSSGIIHYTMVRGKIR
jgi:GNAT superfamily N-acetyltransferase